MHRHPKSQGYSRPSLLTDTPPHEPTTAATTTTTTTNTTTTTTTTTDTTNTTPLLVVPHDSPADSTATMSTATSSEVAPAAPAPAAPAADAPAAATIGGETLQQQVLKQVMAVQEQQAQQAQQQNVAPPASAPPAGGAPDNAGADTDGIMRKMADQQSQIAELNVQLQTKSEDVAKLSEKQRREMKHIYDTVITPWVDDQDGVTAETRDEFKSGIKRLAEEAKEDNGIWQVVMCASSSAHRDRQNAIKKETEFQALNTTYQELKTRVDGGRFSNEEARVGSKRAAVDEVPFHQAGGGNNIWDQFSEYMKTSYHNDSFAPLVPRTK